MQPKSGREATETFLQGTGDVLLSYENEALFAEREGDPVEHVTPPTTFKIENPIAVLKTQQEPRRRPRRSTTSSSPRRRRSCGRRPASARSTRPSRRSSRPTSRRRTKLWTIDDLGGWKKVDSTLFAKGTGSIAIIYDKATS